MATEKNWITQFYSMNFTNFVVRLTAIKKFLIISCKLYNICLPLQYFKKESQRIKEIIIEKYITKFAYF